MSNFQKICQLSQPSLLAWLGLPCFLPRRQQEDSPISGYLADFPFPFMSNDLSQKCELSQRLPLYVQNKPTRRFQTPLGPALFSSQLLDVPLGTDSVTVDPWAE